uniref:Protein kinase domain-containing protein n=1 Tax=viral metagenome TaxID=1070528 RepID=A0A6C0C8Q7_9ZZZZ
MNELNESYCHHQSITVYHKYKLVNILIRILNESNSKMNVLHAAVMILDKYMACCKNIDTDKYVLLGHACFSLSNQLFFSNIDIDYYILKSLNVHARLIQTEKMLLSYVNKIALKLQFELIYETPHTALQKFVDKNKYELQDREILIMKYVVTCLLYNVNSLSYDSDTTLDGIIYFTKIWMLECESKNIKYVEDYLVEDDLSNDISNCVKHICDFICKLNMLTFVMRVNKNPKYDDILKIIPFLPIIEHKTKTLVNVKRQKKRKINLSDYADSCSVSKGTYGEIFMIKYVPCEEMVAIKRQDFGITAIMEVAILKFLDHANIIQLRDIYVLKDDEINMIMPFYRNNLLNVIGKRNMQEKYVIKYTNQLLKALEYCHEMGVIHQDIKPDNIMVTNDFKKVILIDFGISNIYSYDKVRYNSAVCTLPYRPPEILLECKTYNNKVDMWSLGCVVAEMLSGQQMFYGSKRDNEEQLKVIFRKLGLPNEETWTGVTKNKNWIFDDPNAFSKKRYLGVYIDNIQLKKTVDGLLTLNPVNRFCATHAQYVLNEKQVIHYASP